MRVIAIEVDGFLSKDDLLVRAGEAKSKNIVDKSDRESAYVLQTNYRKKSFRNSFYFRGEKSLMLCTYGGNTSSRKMKKNSKRILKALKLKNYRIITSLKRISRIAEQYKISSDQVYYLEVQKKENALLKFFRFIFRLLFSIIKIPVYLVILFLGGAIESTNKTNKKSNAYYKKKKQGNYSTTSGIRVSGGRLPKRMTSGPLVFCYDGSSPRRTGTRGGREVIETNGNLQVFYTKSRDIENIDFIANSVDYYQK